MKKLLVSVILGAVVLGGCGVAEEIPVIDNTETTKQERFTIQSAEAIEIIADKETGCKYLVLSTYSGYGDGVAITPLMKNSTEVDCGE